MADSEATAKWKRIVENLMAKAASTDSEEEREAIMDKVYALMAKFSIEESMLNFTINNGMPEEVINRQLRILPPHYLAKLNLLDASAKLAGVQMVRMQNKMDFKLFGYERDQDMVVMLYASLGVQMLTMLEAADKIERPKGMHRKTFFHSWTMGFSAEVLRRVTEIVNRTKEEVRNNPVTGNGMELVLREKTQVIRRAVLDMFPNLRNISTSSSPINGQVYGMGQRAGQYADLGGQRVGSNRQRAIGN